jgi:D-tyrosyl-tRNA(Tyr) deacylase
VRALLQRVSEARVAVDGNTVAGIERGLLVFLGVYPTDGTAEVEWMAEKVLRLRVFADAAGLMNASVMDVAGGVLVVSQFTLAADTSRGRRPGFSTAAPPEIAEPIYEQFLAALRQRWSQVAAGIFGADMMVSLVNDGPVTLLLEK